MDFSEELHFKLLEEFRQRRLKFIDMDSLLRTLHFYAISGTLQAGSSQESSQTKFIEAVDRHIGKNCEDLTAGQMIWLFRLYTLLKVQASVCTLSQKLLIKIQR